MSGVKKAAVSLGLAELLNKKGIESVLFIDDGFDALSDQEPTDGEQDEIWASVQADAAAMAVALELGAADAGWFGSAEIARILGFEQGDPLRRLVEESRYVVDHRNKAVVLRAAMDYLASVGVEVRRAGKSDWREHVTGVQIIFLDWRLGHDEDEQSVRNAAEAARFIHGQSPKPFLVLISSDPDVKSKSEAFSRASGLVGGMFDALPKEWLADPLGVDVNLSILLELYSAGDAVQSFMEAMRQETSLAVGRFLDKVSKLNVSDYANLQHFALRKDGHPLGDYLVDLFSGLWADALFQGPLRQQLLAMSRLDFSSLPALVGPSDALVDLHNGAVFDMHVGPLASHPHQPSEAAPARPKLTLGDVIVRRSEGSVAEIHVVINPSCDLAESPKHGRKVPDDQSVLLVPGDVVRVDHAERTDRKDLGDTPLFKIDSDAPMRIQWSSKKLRAVPYKEFPAWMSKNRERVARMRTLYALALQRQVSSELTRVGVPAPPPIYGQVNGVLARCRAARFLGDERAVAQGRLVMARDAKGDTVVFDHAFVIDLSRRIRDDLVDWAAAPGLKDKPQDLAHRSEVTRALGDVGEWARLCKPFELPLEGAKFFSGALLICRERPNGLDRKVLACLILDMEAFPAAAVGLA